MQIPDEIVQKALQAAEFCDNSATRRWMRAALSAALPGIVEAETSALRAERDALKALLGEAEVSAPRLQQQIVNPPAKLDQ